MKKVLGIAIIAFSSLIVAGCSNSSDDTSNEVRIIAPEGMPSFSMANMIVNNDQIMDDYEVEYETFAVPSEVQNDLMKSEADIAIAPSTMTSNVYNQTGDYQILGTAVYGTLYLVTTSANYDESVELTLADLSNETIIVIGENATPDLTLQYVLGENNITDATLSYVANGPAALTELETNDDLEFALMPEPVVTANAAKWTSKIDLNQEFINIDGNEAYEEGFPQATLIVKTSFAENNEAFVEEFQEKLVESIAWIKDDSNADEIKEIAADVGLGFPGTMLFATRNSINYGYAKASNDTQKELYKNYLEIFMEKNAASIGGEVPSDEIFYY